MLNIFNYVYTLQEIAEVLDLDANSITLINYYSKRQEIDKICSNIPILSKFKPFLKLIQIKKKKIYVIPAKIFELYLETGLLPDTGIDYREPDINKKEFWEYNSSYFYELCTKNNWEFALDYFKKIDENIEEEDIWNIFLAGCARMNYYQESNIDVDQRIKLAIMEYMMRRPQFFTSNDFVDNPLLHKNQKDKE